MNKIITEDKLVCTEKEDALENNQEHFVKPVALLIKKHIAKTHSYLI